VRTRMRGVVEAGGENPPAIRFSQCSLSKFGYRHWALNSKILFMRFDSLYFMHCICRQVTFTTVWATYDWYIFNHKKAVFLPVTTGNVPNMRPIFTTNITNQCSHLIHLYIR